MITVIQAILSVGCTDSLMSQINNKRMVLSCEGEGIKINLLLFWFWFLTTLAVTTVVALLDITQKRKITLREIGFLVFGVFVASFPSMV